MPLKITTSRLFEDDGASKVLESKINFKHEEFKSVFYISRYLEREPNDKHSIKCLLVVLKIYSLGTVKRNAFIL